jgi:hypothetical protein
MRGFPALLRARGYYTSNNVKTDYNTGNYSDIIKVSGMKAASPRTGETADLLRKHGGKTGEELKAEGK